MISIDIFRHGTTIPQYDENGRQTNSSMWEQVEHFDCVEHVWFYNAYKNTDVMSYGRTKEQEQNHKLFYIEVKNQPHHNNFNIFLGDYVREVNCEGYWWKILAYNELEIFKGCWYIILRAQRLSQREVHRLGIPDLETEGEIPTGR